MLNADKWKRPTPVFAVGDSVIEIGGQDFTYLEQ